MKRKWIELAGKSKQDSKGSEVSETEKEEANLVTDSEKQKRKKEKRLRRYENNEFNYNTFNFVSRICAKEKLTRSRIESQTKFFFRVEKKVLSAKRAW